MRKACGPTAPGRHDDEPFRRATLRIDDYDPRWPVMFAAEAALLRRCLGDHVVAIEHVGSTAVPGLAAKPIIDILAGVRDYQRFESLVRRLEGADYVYTPEAETDDPDRRVFRKGPSDPTRLRTHHVHVTEVSGAYWRRILAFREHLRAHPEVADGYVALKRRLVARYADQSRAYTAGKSAFVSEVERLAGVTCESARYPQIS